MLFERLRDLGDLKNLTMCLQFDTFIFNKTLGFTKIRKDHIL